MRIDEDEAGVLIDELSYQLAEEDESLMAAMVDHDVVCPDAWVERHREWREQGTGVPQFSATIQYKSPREEGPMIACDYINVRVEGTFKETRQGLKIDTYSVVECDVVDLSEHHEGAY